jgi:hypothetical protein
MAAPEAAPATPALARVMAQRERAAAVVAENILPVTRAGMALRVPSSTVVTARAVVAAVAVVAILEPLSPREMVEPEPITAAVAAVADIRRVVPHGAWGGLAGTVSLSSPIRPQPAPQ